MITALHLLVYSDDAPATRAFFKDVLRWPFVTDGAGGQHSRSSDEQQGGDANDWLIFATGPSELGVHPTADEHDGGSWSSPRHHSISLMCDDLEATMSDISGRGAVFVGEVQDMGFGRGVLVQVPGADDLLLYQPSHTIAHAG